MRMASVHEPLHVHASTSEENTHQHVTFQYVWPVRVAKRLMGSVGELILNVSPAFTTSFNGVAFTWALRLSDECVLGSDGGAAPGAEGAAPRAAHASVLLYYKDGPAQDVCVDEARVTVAEAESGVVFPGELIMSECEFTKGSGWPAKPVLPEDHTALTEFVHARIGSVLQITVEIRMREALFQPLTYLPSVDVRSQRIEEVCLRFINGIKDGSILVPNMELLDSKDDKFSMHRLMFVYGCDLVERECAGDDDDNNSLLKQIRSTFAHIYFNKVLLKELRFYEDFLSLVEGVVNAHLPALKREAERWICREVMRDTVEVSFVQQMLLLAERFGLQVLKMVATGVLADRVCSHSDPPKELVQIKHDLRHIASQMSTSTDDDSSIDVDETLVGSVLEDLQSLTRRMRRVSMSHSPTLSPSASNSNSSSSSATPTVALSPSPESSARRSSNSSPPNRSPTFDPTKRFKRVELDVGF